MDYISKKIVYIGFTIGVLLTLFVSTNFKDIRLDILNKEVLKKTISEIKPNMIFHLAAQSIVKESFNNPYETIDINVMGSLNILEACYELNSNLSILMITSDKLIKCLNIALIISSSKSIFYRLSNLRYI